jgi:hypothetical protein
MSHSRVVLRSLLILLFLAALFAVALLVTMLPAHASSHQAALPGDVVISEFRTHGPNGPTDDFVELYNRTNTLINISGWTINTSASSGPVSVLVTIGSNIALQAGQHFLAVGPAYNGSVLADAKFSTAITDDGGIALLKADGTTIVDQVGMSSSSTYLEGTPLDPLPSGITDQSYERKLGCTDTNDNISDFYLRIPSDPQNSFSTLSLCGVVALPSNTPTATLTSTSTLTPTPTLTSTSTLTPTPTLTLSPTSTSAFYNPAVIINEIGWSGTIADSTAKWIELYNPQAFPINLNNWTLGGQYSGNSPNIILTGIIPAKGYYLLVYGSSAQVAATPAPGTCVVFNAADVTYDQIFSGYLSSYGQTLVLKDPIGIWMDTANLSSYYWPAGSTTNHASMERRGVVPDSPDAWITYADTTGTVRDCDGNRVFGTPKNQNWSWGKLQTPSPTPAPTKKPTPRPPTPFAHVVINEFLPRPGFDWNNDGVVNDYDEFIEIENLGPINVNLSGWKLDNVSNGSSHLYSLPSRTLKSGERAVYYGSVTKIPLYDSGGTVRLINSRGVVVDARGYGPVPGPDQSHCRLPDGDGYWTYPCFPSPGLENARTGSVPALPPGNAASQPLPTPCLLPDTVPDVFREPVCHPFGADIWNPGYWDDPAGQLKFPVQDIYNKWQTTVQ